MKFPSDLPYIRAIGGRLDQTFAGHFQHRSGDRLSDHF